MTCQLPADCLNEIFEYLKEDRTSLRSCLLVNCLWCEVAARFLWRDIWDFYNLCYDTYTNNQAHIPLAILSTLVSCLPNESKNLLYMNEIFIPTPASKPPFLNYVSFIKALSINSIDQIIEDSLTNNEQINTSKSLDYSKYLIFQELFKAFMNQISSLKSLDYRLGFIKIVPFTYFPGAKDCLRDLSIFSCASDIYPEFFYQLSQVCHNIQSLTIEFGNNVSINGLKELICLQNNLKNLTLSAYEDKDWTDIIPVLTTKHYDTLTKLHIHSDKENMSLSFIASFLNLQELVISNLNDVSSFKEFNELQNVTFSKLQILKIPYESPRVEILMRFLENNGRNLNELNIDGINQTLRLSVTKFCPNLKKISMIFRNDELDTLITLFNSCKHLESIKIWCGDDCLDEKLMLEVVAKYSPQSFHELKIYNESPSELSSEDLESFLISWGDRLPQKPLTLIIYDDFYNISLDEENLKIIEKYIRLRIVKRFEKKEFDAEE